MSLSLSRRLAATPAPWREVLPALVLIIAVVLVIYRETAGSMVATWVRSETFTHAFLVPPIVLWLIWRQRDQLRPLRPEPNAWMLLPMAVVGFCWLLGDMGSLNSLSQLAMTALIVLAVPAVLGLRITRVILFPLAFLFFSVPIGEFLFPQLMAWTADFTAMALRATGIPVYREGMQIVIPSGNWSVVEACSGVRYLIASFMAGSLFAYLNYQAAWRRWAFVGIAIVVPIVANWLRAYLIVLLGHVSNNKLAVGTDHLIYGWVFFAIVMGLMFTIGTLWTEPATPRAGVATHDKPRDKAWPASRLWIVTAAAVALMVLPQLTTRLIGTLDDTATPQLGAPDRLAEGWQANPAALTDWKPAFRHPMAESNIRYSRQGQDIGVYVAYYRGQSYERKLVSSENELVRSNDPVWVVQAPAQSLRLTGNGGPLEFRTTTLQSIRRSSAPVEQLAVWQIYWAGGRLMADDWRVTLATAIDRLLGRGDDSAAILLYTRVEDAPDSAARLEAFARANIDLIAARLQKTRDGVPTPNIASTTTRGTTP